MRRTWISGKNDVADGSPLHSGVSDHRNVFIDTSRSAPASSWSFFFSLVRISFDDGRALGGGESAVQEVVVGALIEHGVRDCEFVRYSSTFWQHHTNHCKISNTIQCIVHTRETTQPEAVTFARCLVSDVQAILALLLRADTREAVSLFQDGRIDLPIRREGQHQPENGT